LHQEICRLALKEKLPRQMHLAESREESDFFFDATGKIATELFPHVRWDDYLPSPLRTSATAWLDTLGVLDGSVTAVHGVHLTPADMELLLQRGVGVVLCPRSNDKLDVGIAPAALLKKRGIPLALGTDSLASNDSLSLWDEMRFLLDTFSGVFTPAEALEMATLGAARALSLADRIGSLEAGKRADFLLVELPGGVTDTTLHETLIQAGDLFEVFIAGSPVA